MGFGVLLVIGISTSLHVVLARSLTQDWPAKKSYENADHMLAKRYLIPTHTRSRIVNWSK